MIERALHLTSLPDPVSAASMQRLYWGPEFCQNLIPNVEDTGIVLKFCRKRGLGFTLMTPFVTDEGLDKLKKIFHFLKSEGRRCEVVVNDLGVLAWLQTQHGAFFQKAAGRLLTRQQRMPGLDDPEFDGLFSGLPSKKIKIQKKAGGRHFLAGLKRSHLHAAYSQKFFSRLGIRRLELNNTYQGIDLKGIPFKKSLYTPFVNIATTRFCPMEAPCHEIRRIGPCSRECLKHHDDLSIQGRPFSFHKRGNTLFYRNPVNLALLGQRAIDRVVFQYSSLQENDF